MCLSAYSASQPQAEKTQRRKRFLFPGKASCIKELKAGQKAHSKMCHKTLQRRPRSFVVRGERKKKKDFEQYCLMGLCIHNSFPFTIPYHWTQAQVLPVPVTSYIILRQILSKQGIDHKAAAKILNLPRRISDRQIKKQYSSPKQYILLSVNTHLFRLALTRSSGSIHFCSTFLVP